MERFTVCLVAACDEGIAALDSGGKRRFVVRLTNPWAVEGVASMA